VRPAAALTATEIRTLPAVRRRSRRSAGLPGLRDRALLPTCFTGGLRRSELVALDREDVHFTADGLVLRIRQSKGDQEGQGADVGIARGRRPDTCPVRAMEFWLRRAGIAYGAAFPRLTAVGTNEGGLTGNGVWKILRRRRPAGLMVDARKRLSPHGMRVGFITEAYLSGALDEQVMAHARQKDITTTRRYRERAKTVATARRNCWISQPGMRSSTLVRPTLRTAAGEADALAPAHTGWLRHDWFRPGGRDRGVPIGGCGGRDDPLAVFGP
jgi:integrase